MGRKKSARVDEEFEQRAARLRQRRQLILMGVSPPYASQLVNGVRVPGYKKALEIYEKTGLEFGDAIKHAKHALAENAPEKRTKKTNAHGSEVDSKR